MPGHSPKRILVAYSKSSTFTSTVVDYIMTLKQFTDYEVHYVHCSLDARMTFDFNDYDVLFHNYCGRLCYEGFISPDYERAVINFRGLKIVAVQDDYDWTAMVHRAIRRMGFHVLLTCIQREFWPLVYPASELPGVHIIQGLTGYVPEKLLENRPAIIPLKDRTVPIAYRGRDIGAKYGRLGYDKFIIGDQMIRMCEARGIPHNIAMDEDSRIYGDAWFEFLGSSRTMLGSESASNAFDFDGDLAQQIAEFKQEHGRTPGYQEFRHILDPLEAPFDVGQISPRAFECAVMMTPMILFRGRYSGAMEPDVHYISLEKDFSNADAVLSRLDDLDYLQGFADRAYERLVSSGKYGYQTLAAKLSDTIEEQYPIRVDQNWVQYCESTRSRFITLHKPAEFDEIERIRHELLLEGPTEYPIEKFDYKAFYDNLNQQIIAYQTSVAEEIEDGKFAEEIVDGEKTIKNNNPPVKTLIKISPPDNIDSPMPEKNTSVPSKHFVARALLASWQIIPEKLRFSLLRILKLS